MKENVLLQGPTGFFSPMMLMSVCCITADKDQWRMLTPENTMDVL